MDSSSWGTSDWFNAINSAALTWYGAYQSQGATIPQVGGATGQQGASLVTTPGGNVYATISPSVLIVAALGVVALVYVLKK